jgi:hypothetical protein
MTHGAFLAVCVLQVGACDVSMVCSVLPETNVAFKHLTVGQMCALAVCVQYAQANAKRPAEQHHRNASSVEPCISVQGLRA